MHGALQDLFPGDPGVLCGGCTIHNERSGVGMSDHGEE